MSDTGSGLDRQNSVTQLVVGAWREALEEDGVGGIFLVSFMAITTISALPIWISLAWLEAIGLYSIETGVGP